MKFRITQKEAKKIPRCFDCEGVFPYHKLKCAWYDDSYSFPKTIVLNGIPIKGKK